jgi:transmembrane sensor
MLSEKDYTAIAKQLAGGSSLDEQAQVEQLQQNYPQELKILTEIWDVAKPVEDHTAEFDEAAAWQQMQARLAPPKAPSTPVRRFEFRPMRWAVAASILLVVGAWSYYRWIFNPTVVEYNPHSQMAKVILPDQTTILLHPGASVTHRKYFKEKDRKVSIRGDGFFDVAHNEQQPFVVDLGKAELRVMGTAFDIHYDTARIEVAVTRGKVKFGKKNTSEMLFLGAGEKALLVGDELAKVEPPLPPEPPAPEKPKKKLPKADSTIYIWDGNLYPPGEAREAKEDTTKR